MNRLILCILGLFLCEAPLAGDRPTVEVDGVKYYLVEEVASQSYPNTARGYCVLNGSSGDNSSDSAYDPDGEYSPLAILDASGAISQTLKSSAGAWVLSSVTCY